MGFTKWAIVNPDVRGIIDPRVPTMVPVGMKSPLANLQPLFLLNGFLAANMSLSCGDSLAGSERYFPILC
jgi:hypothetical protein